MHEQGVPQQQELNLAHEGRLDLAQEGVLEGVLEVLEVLEGVQEGVQERLLVPDIQARVDQYDGNSGGVYWDYDEGIAGLWHSDNTRSEYLEYPDYPSYYSPPSGYPSFSDDNNQDIPQQYQGYDSSGVTNVDNSLSSDSKSWINQNVGGLERHQPGDHYLASGSFGEPTEVAEKPGPLIALLDHLAAALGSEPPQYEYPDQRIENQVRVANRRAGTLTNILQAKLGETIVIGRLVYLNPEKGDLIFLIPLQGVVEHGEHGKGTSSQASRMGGLHNL